MTSTTDLDLDQMMAALVDMDLDDEFYVRLEAGLIASSTDEARARELCDRLHAGFRDLPDIEPPPGWEERLERRRRWERRLEIRRVVGQRRAPRG